MSPFREVLDTFINLIIFCGNLMFFSANRTFVYNPWTPVMVSHSTVIALLWFYSCWYCRFRFVVSIICNSPFSNIFLSFPILGNFHDIFSHQFQIRSCYRIFSFHDLLFIFFYRVIIITIILLKNFNSSTKRQSSNC